MKRDTAPPLKKSKVDNDSREASDVWKRSQGFGALLEINLRRTGDDLGCTGPSNAST